MSDAFDAGTLAFYDRAAADYAGAGGGKVSRHLPGFLALLPAGGRVLELGCGTGRDAAAMIAAGFAVDATDASAAMVAEAARRHGVAARVMRFDELDAEAAYDGVFANACLLHAPRDAMPDILIRIRRALRPGGWHLASFKAGTGQGRDDHGRLFNYPDADWLGGIYRAAGFQLVQIAAYQGGTLGGGKIPWLVVTARR